MNNLKVLYEYVKVNDQFDQNQPHTFQAINQLRGLNIKKNELLDIIDEVKASMSGVREILDETQLHHQDSSWQVCLENTIRQNFKLPGMESTETVLLETNNQNLLNIWIEKFNENRDIYSYVSFR